MRTRLLVILLAALSACGDDGVHHLADAPTLPIIDAPADVAIDAPDPMVSLDITIAGTGAGMVTSSPAGITCANGTCSGDFDPNTVITLTAVPGIGSVFAGWSGGGCTGTTPTCEVTLAQAASVTATFNLARYAVTVTKSGQGTGTIAGNGINCGTTCTVMVDHGTMITLAQTPGNLSVFAGWGGACSGTASCMVTVTAPTTITANFALDNLTLFVSKGGNGAGTITSTPAGINCGADCSESYTAGQMVTLTAAASTGSTFTGWSGDGCTGTGTCMVTVNTASTVTATFTLQQFALDVTRAGTGGGTVVSNPTGIACGADCTESYDYNSTVTLTATPSLGSSFAGWSGACTGTAMCVVTMTQARAVTATFTLQQFALTTTVTGNGTVTSAPAGIACPTDCTESYSFGQMVTLTAAAGNGSTFMGWGGACTGTGACSVTIDAAKSVTASFSINMYTLTVAKAGNGMGTVSGTGISCGSDCSESVNFGTMISLTATASTGSTFTGWSGACTGTGACAVTVDGAKSATATFTLQKFTLTAAKIGNGNGTITSTPAGISCGADCTEDYDYGTVVSLTAATSVGSTFLGWSGACTGTGACSVTVDAAKSVTATFSLQRFTLSASLSPAGNGSGTITSAPAGITCGVDCSELYDYGTMVTLTATPAIGSTFAGWSGACTTTTGPCIVTMDAAKSATARFNLQTFAVTVTPAGLGTGTVTSSPAGITCGPDCSEPYNYGEMVTLTATASVPSSTFGGWGGACTNATGTCTVTVDAAKSVTATFNLVTRNLTTGTAGNGSGTIMSSPTGTSCGANCATYNHGTMVMLTANPGTGSSFAGWSGACTNLTGACMVTMDAAKSVTATFTLMKFAVSVSFAGLGSGTVMSSPAGINCTSNCSVNFNYGDMVTLTAAASMPSSTFGGWTGACTNATGTCTVTVTAARSVTATFNLQSYGVTTGTTGNGTGTISSSPTGTSCGANCASHPYGTMVMLSANPGTGSTFAGWGGACTNVTGPCMVTVDGAKSVTATFTLVKVALTVSTTGGQGTGSVSSSPAGINCGATCMASFNYGDMVTLTPLANTPSSTFGGWNGGGCTGTGACTVTLTTATTVTAIFNVATYDLTVTENGTGGGTVTSAPLGIDCPLTACFKSFGYNTSVTLTAAANNTSDFAGWGGACTNTTGPCTVTMAGARNVTATFTKKQPINLSIKFSGNGSGTVYVTVAGNMQSCTGTCGFTFNAGSAITMTGVGASTTEAIRSTFITWAGSGSAINCTGNGTCSFTLNAATTVDASFKLNPNFMFTTMGKYSGDLGGVGGADAKCQAAADAKGLKGKFLAYISSPNPALNAPSRFAGASAWVLPNGTKLVQDILDFGAATLANPPVIDETGSVLADIQTRPLAWTGTGANLGINDNACYATNGPWTYGDNQLRGEAGSPSLNQSAIVDIGAIGCSTPLHLYCFGIDRRTTF